MMISSSNFLFYAWVSLKKSQTVESFQNDSRSKTQNFHSKNDFPKNILISFVDTFFQ